MSNQTGRLLPLRSGLPTENMAIDQALLKSIESTGTPVLRLYTWSRPTLSLGYFQKVADRQLHRESAALACVRRATGGGAIVHHRELTYSFVFPVSADTAGPRLKLYRQTHQAIVAALAEYGVHAAAYRTLARSGGERSGGGDPFLCFQRRTDEDLLISGYKILGSAQRKTRHAVLQHGSLLLASSPWAPQLPGIAELTATNIVPERFGRSLAAKLGQICSIDWTPDQLSPSEQSRAAEIERQQFGSPSWHRRR